MYVCEYFSSKNFSRQVELKLVSALILADTRKMQRLPRHNYPRTYISNGNMENNSNRLRQVVQQFVSDKLLMPNTFKKT